MQKSRVAIVILLTLLPWPAVWVGMYEFRNIMWTFFAYHFVCLLPAIIWGRKLWLPHVFMPAGKQWLIVLAAAMGACFLGLFVYSSTGEVILSKTEVMKVMTERGFNGTYLLPLGVYFVVVNATCEELFWRGVVLNELELVNERYRFAGTIWTALTFSAWHWLVVRTLLKSGWAELAVVGILVMGLYCSWLYRKTQSIVIPILWHALVFDLAIMAMFTVLVFSN
jgi:membrane protease YdiL (CAAX protease family)